MYDYTRVTLELKQLAERYEPCHLSSAGKSLCGRSLYLFRIGNGTKNVLYAGAFHGLEGITAAVLTHFCRRICQAQESNLTVYGVPVRPLLEKISFYCIPMVNPDGVEISVCGEKTAGKYSNISAGKAHRWQANARGVDINHNFDAGWHVLHQMEQNAGITGPGPTRYGGAFPESEPETSALTALCRKIPFRLVIALHTQGEEIYWQYGEHTPKESSSMAEKFAEVSGYRAAFPEPMASFGGFKDWFIETFHRPGFTIEAGKGKNPLPFSKLCAIESKIFPILAIGLQMAALENYGISH